MPVQNIDSHRWLAEDILTDGPIQNIAYYLNQTGFIPSGGGLTFNAKAYGATGNGVTDDTISIQAAITAAQAVNGTVQLPTGLYKLTSPLVFTSNVSMEGLGVGEQPITSTTDDGPTASPYLTGSVLMQSTAATDAIQISGTGANVHLKNFGIEFGPLIMFRNTGHGINASPTATLGGGGHNSGVYSQLWQNIFVFGQDGNHYAFYLLNSIGGTHINLRSHGGGGIAMVADNTVQNYGNAVFINPYVEYYIGGSANGYTVQSRASSGLGAMNLLVWVRPQVNATAIPAAFSGLGATSLAGTNYMWKDVNTPLYQLLINPDLEQVVNNTYPVTFGTSTVAEGSFLIDAAWQSANDPGITQQLFNQLTVQGSGLNSDFLVNPSGSTPSNPFGYYIAALASGQAWRVGANGGYGVQTQFVGRLQVASQFGSVEIDGNIRSGAWPTMVGGSTTDPSLVVNGTQTGAPVEVVNAPTGQTVDIVQWQVNGSTLAKVGVAGVITQPGIATTAITSGALAQPAFSTGTAQQLSTTRDMTAVIAMTATTIAGTCAIALSPDGTTYTTVATLTPGVSAAVESQAVAVPVNWRLRLTFTNATVVVTVY